MRDGEGLADHAADGEADVLHALDAEEVERDGDVVGERSNRVVAADGIVYVGAERRLWALALDRSAATRR